MKYSKLGLLLLSAVLVCGTLFPRTAQADSAISFEFFYDSLDPYGEWVDLPDYGLCWHPNNVDEDWAPYTDGYWANTDAGWTWVSYEDWGGITYHYGRWAKIPGEGWFWVPDYEWAPAWVSWRSSDDYVGWAPLPPSARWEPSIGFSFWVDSYCDIGPSYYNFCEVRHFGNPALRPVIIDRRRNVAIINHTTNITNITINKNTRIVYNGGPDYATISRKSLRPIQTLKLRQQTDVGDYRNNRGSIMARQRGNELLVVAPRVEAPSAKFRPARTARTLPKSTFDTGWAGVSDPKVRTELHSKIKQEARNVTPQQAPAAAPSERELQSFDQRLKAQPVRPGLPSVAPAMDAGSSRNGRPQAGKQGAPVESQVREKAPLPSPVPNQEPGNQTRNNRVAPAGAESTPVQNPASSPSTGKQGKHGESIRPFLQPERKQETSVPAVEPRQEESPSQARSRAQQNENAAQAAQERRRNALEEQSRAQENQRKQKAIQEQSQRDQQRAQEKALRRESDAQEAQSQQRQQVQRAQEQQRSQESQQRRLEQTQRSQEQNVRQQRDSQESQQRQVEQRSRQVERHQAQQQPSSTPQKSQERQEKRSGKDKDKDSER